MSRNTTQNLALPILLAGLLGACTAGNGEGLDDNGRPLSESSANSGNTETETTSNTTTGNGLFTRVQKEVFDIDCALSGCHTGSASPLGLNLAEGKSYADLVNKGSNQIDSLLLVEPFNPDASYLVQKIEGGSGGGDQMPLNRPPLSTEQMALVRAWINEGALEDSDTSEEEETIDPTLSNIQKTIFDTRCTSCHSGDYTAGALNLSEGKSYGQLVNRALQFDAANNILVIPADPDNSFLLKKLTGTDLGTINDSDYKGQQMPLGGPYLSDDEIALIRQWIVAGANND